MADSAASLTLVLEPVGEQGWASGFENLLRRELSAWWRTRFGPIQAAIWVGALDGLLALPLGLMPRIAPDSIAEYGSLLNAGLNAFFQMGTILVAIGVMVLAQDALVGEKESGNAAWVLSKPVSRPAFVLAKLAAYVLNLGVLVVGLPAVGAYLVLSAVTGTAPAIWAYLAGLGLLGLHTLFYLSLVLLLGALFRTRIPVIGIAFGVFLGQQMLADFLGPAVGMLPLVLVNLSAAVAMEGAVPTGVLLLPVATTAALILLCVVGALWRFQREEL